MQVLKSMNTDGLERQLLFLRKSGMTETIIENMKEMEPQIFLTDVRKGLMNGHLNQINEIETCGDASSDVETIWPIVELSISRSSVPQKYLHEYNEYQEMLANNALLAQRILEDVPQPLPEEGEKIVLGFHCGYPGCERIFQSKQGVKYHRSIHHIGFRDEIRSEPTKASLITRFNTPNPNSVKKFKCGFPGCEQSFCSKTGLICHRGSHFGETPVKTSDAIKMIKGLKKKKKGKGTHVEDEDPHEAPEVPNGDTSFDMIQNIMNGTSDAPEQNTHGTSDSNILVVETKICVSRQKVLIQYLCGFPGMIHLHL